MQVAITWKYNDKIGKWVAYVLYNQYCVMLVVRQSEAECEAWAKKNLPIFLTGKLPAYG